MKINTSYYNNNLKKSGPEIHRPAIHVLPLGTTTQAGMGRRRRWWDVPNQQEDQGNLVVPLILYDPPLLGYLFT
jgi:hypothetical protein